MPQGIRLDKKDSGAISSAVEQTFAQLAAKEAVEISDLHAAASEAALEKQRQETEKWKGEVDRLRRCIACVLPCHIN